MRRSTLLLFTGFVLGFALGMFVWQKKFVRPLRSENAKLREQANDAEKLRTENAKLAGERVEPAELNRLRDGQTELLRLRGQVSQLRQRLNEAQAATNRAAVATQPAADETAPSPVETFTAKATMKIGWQQTMVAGGWKLPSGNRGLILLQPLADDTNPGAVQVRVQILELPESLMTGLGNLDASSKDARGYEVLFTEERHTLLSKVQNTEGASVIATPSVITLSGRQAQVAVVEQFTGPNGENFSVGPVVNITPTISADNQLVEIAMDAQLNLRKSTK